MKRITYFVMALALVLGFAQCKKEKLEPENEDNQVMITLNVGGGNNGSRAEVVPPHVNFKVHDTILVASAGKYVGYLEHNGTRFSGFITDPVEGHPLYFYFLGNKADVSGLTEGSSTTCTVNISDQTYQTENPTLPVISMAPSNETYPSDGNHYTARLHNKCSLMKFNVTTPSTDPICITGMNNQVTVNFADPTGTTNGFTYGKEDDGILKMVGGNAAERWLIVLPQDALEETGEAFSEDYAYFGTRPELPAIGASQCFSGGIAMEISTVGWDGDLSKLTEGVSERYATATNGMTISGTLTADVKVSIADGATVTLNGANINNGSKSGSVSCAGITCVGSATINLTGGSIINSSSAGYPGIQAGPSGNTLAIQGAGSLSAQGGSNAPGIGGGNDITCGNISLLGGQISACGGDNAPGLGNGQNGLCGDIHISNSVEKLNITGGSGASKSISTSGDSSLSIDNLDDVSYFDTIPFVYHPVNLSGLTEDYVAENGDVFRGELTHNVTINDPNATITLSGVNITYGGIICAQPNVRIVCFQANSLIANNGAGIQAPSSGKISIEGTGSLNVESTAYGCAGIGSNINTACGDIYIKLKGGKITASGGEGGAGIGSGKGGSCGDIDIEGGAVTATGGEGASNIGAGEGGNCGTVLHPINGLFSVSPTKQVRFSRGNLLSDSTFAVNQWDRGAYFSSNEWTAPSDDWYVLSADEWEYLCHRINKVGFATVNDIHGLIILPDDYSGSITKPYDFVNTTSYSVPWKDNEYSGDTWATMENNGVVFLPAHALNPDSYYWSSSGMFNFGCHKSSQGSGSLISIGGGVLTTWTRSVAHITELLPEYAYVRLVRTEQTN